MTNEDSRNDRAVTPKKAKGHTPTPWTVKTDYSFEDYILREIATLYSGKSHDPISHIYGSGEPVSAEKDAEFIVEAVNAYGSLKRENEALKLKCEMHVEYGSKPDQLIENLTEEIKNKADLIETMTNDLYKYIGRCNQLVECLAEVIEDSDCYCIDNRLLSCGHCNAARLLKSLPETERGQSGKEV